VAADEEARHLRLTRSRVGRSLFHLCNALPFHARNR
jgi:hypothetical protein